MSELPEILFLGIALYVLYRFVFNFLLPIVRTTRQVRQQFRNVQENMRNQQQGNSFQQGSYDQQSYGQHYDQQPASQPGPAPAPKKSSAPAAHTDGLGEYIDFEEIK